MDKHLIGASHNVEVHPDVVYVGSTTPLAMGYNANPPKEWQRDPVIDSWVGHTH